jgi:hypothetical protein
MKNEGWNFVAHLFPNSKCMTGLLGALLLGVLVMYLRSSAKCFRLKEISIKLTFFFKQIKPAVHLLWCIM